MKLPAVMRHCDGLSTSNDGQRRRRGQGLKATDVEAEARAWQLQFGPPVRSGADAPMERLMPCGMQESPRITSWRAEKWTCMTPHIDATLAAPHSQPTSQV